jgi:hypothetical protein
VVPGSMGTRSYVVSGKGSAASHHSCSHGAGRRMSRGQARRELTVDSLRTAMTGRSWNADAAEKLIDEHPSAYKDIDQVMADQADLVTIEHTLSQVFNDKGVVGMAPPAQAGPSPLTALASDVATAVRSDGTNHTLFACPLAISGSLSRYLNASSLSSRLAACRAS